MVQMKELLQQLKQANIKTVRTNLDIGEKRFTAGMAKAGYSYSQKSKSWIYIGQGKEPLNKEFEGFLPLLQRQKRVNAIDKPTSQLPVKVESKIINNKDFQNAEIITSSIKKVTYEIEEHLHEAVKIKAIQEKRNVSDVVNEIFRNALT